jgi:hypothetical protein
MGEEKFPGEEVEQLKAKARVEDVFPEADACPDCERARRESGDATFLCREHLRRVYGV